MRLSEQQTVETGFNAQILVLEGRFDKHRRGRRGTGIDGNIHSPTLQHFVFLDQMVDLNFGLFGIFLESRQCLLQFPYLFLVAIPFLIEMHS